MSMPVILKELMRSEVTLFFLNFYYLLGPANQTNVTLSLDGLLTQMVMAVFSYIYYQSFIAPHHYSIESFLDQV